MNLTDMPVNIWDGVSKIVHTWIDILNFLEILHQVHTITTVRRFLWRGGHISPCPYHSGIYRWHAWTEKAKRKIHFMNEWPYYYEIMF